MLVHLVVWVLDLVVRIRLVFVAVEEILCQDPLDVVDVRVCSPALLLAKVLGQEQVRVFLLEIYYFLHREVWLRIEFLHHIEFWVVNDECYA